MSVTLTQNPATYSFTRTLADYDLTHGGDEEVPETPNARPTPQGTGENPPDWEENWRRVPEYRPIDRELDFAFRDTYNNNAERIFLWNMFRGIIMVSTTNKIWRATGGRFNDTYFRWKVGGES